MTKTKTKLLKRPNMFYIFEKQRIQGYQIWHSCIISTSSVHHQLIIIASFVNHPSMISASSMHHHCIISASSAHHQHIISASSLHHQYINQVTSWVWHVKYNWSSLYSNTFNQAKFEFRTVVRCLVFSVFETNCTDHCSQFCKYNSLHIEQEWALCHNGFIDESYWTDQASSLCWSL